MSKRIFSIAFLGLFLASCGGGGSTPLAITLSTLTAFTTDEDMAYTASISASSNKVSTKYYQPVSNPVNGNLTINTNGSFNYTPNQDFYGSDSFTYKATASVLEDGQATETVSATATVTITINPVNDAPVLTVNSNDTSGFGDLNLIVDQAMTLNVTYSDVDNDLTELTSYVSVSNMEIPSTLQTSSIDIDLSTIAVGGTQNFQVCVKDLSAQTCESFQNWFVANKTAETVNYTDSSGAAATADYNIYYVLGGPSTQNGTQYLFVGDLHSNGVDLNSLGCASNLDCFRQALIESVSTILASDASTFIEGYFNIVVAEPVNQNVSAASDINTGCYSWDTSVYCIGSSELDMNVYEQMLPNFDLLSILTTVQGRGVALGNRNIQAIKSTTYRTLMHELGHSHGYMGDEYLTSDDRDVSYWADFNVNTTTESDPANLKWKHWIEDMTHVPGVDYTTCYNYSDGDAYSQISDIFDDNTTPLNDCECLWFKDYTYDEGTTSATPETDAECHKKVGLFEGNYYGETDNYRPEFWTIMECCRDEYGIVNTEGFAVGSIINQGFTDYTNWPPNTINGGNMLTIAVNAVYDPTKLSVKWYVNGVEDTSLANMVSATFDRPADNSVQTYSFKAVDLTGIVTAPDDPHDPDDFYEGLMNSSFYWYNDTQGFVASPTDTSTFDYGYIWGPLGFAFSIDWSKYPVTTTTSPSSRDLHLSPNRQALILDLEGGPEDLRVSRVTTDLPNKKSLRKGIFISKQDKYVVELLNDQKQVIYKVGIGNPFYARAQHIGYENNPITGGPVDAKNLEIAVPSGINPSSLRLSKRVLEGFVEVKEINLTNQ